MGYFDGLTSALFKESENGKIIFYPYGKLWSGYIITEKEKIKIEKLVKRYYIVSFPITIITAVSFKFYALLLLIIEISLPLIFVKKLLPNAEKTNEKMTFKETVQKMAISMGLTSNIILLLCSILMTTLSVLCFFMPNGRIIGFVGTLFFGFALVEFIFMIKYVLRKNKA